MPPKPCRPNGKPLFFYAAAALLLLLAGAVMLKTLFCGLEIDEEYALSIGYRLVRGDTLFYTMWEPHQLSALTAAGLIALYMGLTGGTTGILLFVRAVMLAVKALLSYWFYRELRGTLGRKGAFLLALVLFLYTPKWFLGPDYISQQFHYTLAGFLCLWHYIRHGFRRPWIVAAGAALLCMSFLAFPQSIFAAPVFLVGLWLLGARRGEKKLLGIPRGALVFALGCLACGAVFLAYLLQGLSFSMLLSRAQLILNDPQYDFSTAQRLALLAGQARDVAVFLAKPLAAALAVAVLGCARDLAKKQIRNVRYWLNLLFLLFSLFTVLLCLYRALRDSSLDERYFCVALTIAGVWFYRGGRGTPREVLFWLGYLPGVAAYLLILRSTLLGLAPTFMYLSWPAFCAVAAMLCSAQAAAAGQQDPTAPTALSPRWGYGVLLVLFAFLAVCRGWLVLTTGWHPQNLANTELSYLATGPAAGTWADVPTADRYRALEQALAGRTGQKVLISTGDVDGLAFLMENGTLQVAQASVISSTDSDTRFAGYYNELPEKKPQVVLYNLDCVRDLTVFHTWLETNFTVTARTTVTSGTARLEVLEIAP